MNSTAQTDSHSTVSLPEREEYAAPEVNIFETSEGYVLEAEMPGVGKDGLEITLEANELTLVGRRAAETFAGEALFRERSSTNYRRVFELDPAIDASKVTAKIVQGVVTITLPKSEQVKPRKITVS